MAPNAQSLPIEDWAFSANFHMLSHRSFIPASASERRREW